MIKKIALIVLSLSLSFRGLALGQASDNFENSNPGNDYNDGIQYNDNGGTGFGALTYLEGNGGGIFTGNLAGSQALGVFSGGTAGNTQALGRNITTSVTAGTFSLDLRFDVDNVAGTTGFNLKGALGTSFGGSELLFIGLTPGSGNGVLFVSDGGGTTSFSIGTLTELRGANITLSIAFNTVASTYSITATSGAQTGGITGTLKDTNGAATGTDALSAVGFGNFNTGNTQNVYFDNLNLVAVPEPATLSLLAGPAILSAWFFVRRRRS